MEKDNPNISLPPVGSLLIAKVRLYTFLSLPEYGGQWFGGSVGNFPFIEKDTPVMYMGELSYFHIKEYFGWKVLYNEKIVGVGIDSCDPNHLFYSYYFDVYRTNLGAGQLSP